MSDYLSGRNSVREALLSGQKTINKIYLSKQAHGAAITDIIRLAREKKVPLHHVPPEKIDSFTEENSQGVVAELSSVTYHDLDSLWEIIKDKERPLIVVLDGIEDPHNAGAIIRSAVALGADGVVLGKWRSAGLTETVTRTSAGASEHIPIARVTNISDALRKLKEYDVWIAGAEAGNRPVGEEKFSFPLAVVIGSEGYGIHQLVKKQCDYLVSIPQAGTISSLNASCAAAIVLYEISKQKFPASWK
ncbi:MAG: 23S rRNA (guanosine(2251)-2'-O)-methyltransferase RlmB [Elusimicrobia bacterium RIFOXYA2_FULL_50_26]|nr:MAG: 23S rRNA (guanosine(2251)-2'-O)-methyltransferase RlmB [Elusimicrobia bacterium RIFOXYA2_FULL_50_26]OGS23705.1 MAG: 23S rRNA (guanosine(2251)-2'-O)-methyltransferase RlmB [Elusimicrobia bacterium RIFOXYB2_FULL_50_12]